ncbi:hypothetical protein BJP40_00185 [Streptomyces sp. CC53]|nr:hypothetical protein BJP40_00185 [Streptomyces sp. CC53]
MAAHAASRAVIMRLPCLWRVSTAGWAWVGIAVVVTVIGAFLSCGADDWGRLLSAALRGGSARAAVALGGDLGDYSLVVRVVHALLLLGVLVVPVRGAAPPLPTYTRIQH